MYFFIFIDALLKQKACFTNNGVPLCDQFAHHIFYNPPITQPIKPAPMTLIC